MYLRIKLTASDEKWVFNLTEAVRLTDRGDELFKVLMF